MAEYRVAGHLFAGTCDDVCQALQTTGEPCTMTWARLSTATENDINQNGWAHVSYLSSGEYLEVEAERKRREEIKERAWAAIMDLGTPG